MTFTVLTIIVVILYSLSSTLVIRSLVRPTTSLASPQNRMLLRGADIVVILSWDFAEAANLDRHGSEPFLWLRHVSGDVGNHDNVPANQPVRPATIIGAIILPLDIVTLIIVLFLPSNTVIASGTPLLHSTYCHCHTCLQPACPRRHTGLIRQ